MFLIHEKNLMTSLPSLGMCLLLLASCSGSDTSSSSTTPAPANSPQAATGTTVQVSATATDPDNDQLHYRWAVTEGTIANVDAPRTTWTIPPGSGLQFAYVLVSDGKGGYSESRAAAMTFDQVVSATATPIPITSPTLGPDYIWGTIFFKGTLGRNVYLPGVTVRISGPGGPFPDVETDKKGEFFFSGLSGAGSYSLFYTIPGMTEQPFSQPISFNPRSPRSYIQQEVNLTGTLQVAGSVRLADKSHCGVRDEFFTDLDPNKSNALKGPVSASAQLLTSNNGPLTSLPSPVNHYGDYLIVRSALPSATDVKVRIHCEQGNDKDSTVVLNVQSGLSKVPAVTLDNSRPEIKSMTILLNGQDIGRPDLPKPRTLFPKFMNNQFTFPDTDLIAEIAYTPGDDAFLSYKGLDTRKSACAYYRALGAVGGCDPISGTPTGAQLTLDQWKQRFNLSPFPTGNPSNPRDPGTQEVRIIYINRADLNFARDMQAVRLSDGSLAYNVCNYAGPQNTTGLGEPVDIGTEHQPNIDLAIENARRGIGRVVCVAMDYSPGANGGQPFTKFYTFGPTGKLLLSVSLDGTREKFMPGSCTACHGGDSYGGHYPDDETGRPDVGSRWQPFDMANLEFSSAQNQDIASIAAVERAIKQLNQMMVPLANGGLSPVPGATIDITPVTTNRTKELIHGWYAGGTLTNQNTAFVPSLYCPPSGGSAPCGQSDLYQQVAQGMCQTCHAAQGLDESFLANIVCGSNTTAKLADNHTMPNALVPFERFWRDSSLPLLAGCSNVPAKHPSL